MNEIIRKIRNFFALHRLPMIIISSLVVISIVVGIIFYNINRPLKDNENVTHVAKDPKSVEDLTKVEQEILGTSDTKTEIEKEVEKSYSDEYKKYENLTEEEKEKLDVIPRKEEVPITEIDEIKEDVDYKKDVLTIPDSYNLKDHITLRVENQQSYGLCWDFASMKSLETNIQLHEGRDLDLSELHLDYYQSNLMYGYRQIHNGGNFSDFVDYSLLTGAVLEETVPYGVTSKNTINGKEFTYFTPNDFNEEIYSKFTSMNTVARATEVVDFPFVTKTDGKVDDEKINEEKLIEFRNVVKLHIMKNGSIYTVIKSTTEKNAYCNKNCGGDHAVSIVGWDDNYSKDNFTSADGSHPLHDGAYIVLNSWGDKYGDGGYYYISYDDQLVESQMSGVLSTSMENAIRIDSIQNPIVKDIINNQLKYYIIDYNNDKYITKMALRKSSSLALQNKNLTSDTLSGLDIFYNISVIDLSDNNITNVSVLTNFKRLYSINLSNNKVTDVSALKDLENLGSINLSGNNNVNGYEQLDNLYQINLSNTNLSALNNISNNERLSQLDLSNNTQLDYNSLKLPKNISYLVLDNTNFKNNNLSNLKNLYSLSIKNNGLKNLDSLRNIKSLTSLDVSNNEITNFSALTEIFGKSDDEDAISEDEDYGYYGYTSLIAKENNISDISIINNIKVDSVDLSNNKITDLSALDNNKIKMIRLSYNKIKKGIKSLKNVNTIYLDHCGISNIDDFSVLEKTDYLVLDDNDITNFKNLKNINQLTSLSINNNKITDLSYISEFENLYNLSLDNNDITDITALNKIEKLNTLSLSGNKKIKGKLTGSISNINLKDCNLDNTFDLNGLSQISYINLSNNTYNNIRDIINNSKSEWISIDADDLAISEEELLQIDTSEKKEKNWYIYGANLNLVMNIDQNNNINLENKYYIRKFLMQQIKSNLVIENGNIDNKVEFIHVINPNNKNVSFKASGISGSNYSLLDINISY